MGSLIAVCSILFPVHCYPKNYTLRDFCLSHADFTSMWRSQQWTHKLCKCIHFLWPSDVYLFIGKLRVKHSELHWHEGQRIAPRIPAVLASSQWEIMSQNWKYQKVSLIIWWNRVLISLVIGCPLDSVCVCACVCVCMWKRGKSGGGLLSFPLNCNELIQVDNGFTLRRHILRKWVSSRIIGINKLHDWLLQRLTLPKTL